jgi:phage terminase large subunit
MPRKSIPITELYDEHKDEEVALKATRVFFENYGSDKRININIGGGGSSKSHSIIQLLLYKFLTERNKKILVIRKTMPSIRTSVLVPFHEIIDAFGVRTRIKEDKVGMNFFFNTNVIHFNGLDDPEKIKSSNWNYIWFEEATDITENDFNTVRLYLRAPSVDGHINQIFLSFNPIDEFHWVKEKLIDNPSFQKDIKVIHSTYKDNPFLDADSRRTYEELIEQDINFYRIYALGEWGKLENLIYRNWDIVKSVPPEIKGGMVLYGIDFGFNDPTVVTKVTVKDREVFLEEVLYKSGMTNAQLIGFLENELPKPEWNRRIYCDAAEPMRIKELRTAGFNVLMAQKNVNDGIDMCKRLRFHVLESSTNIIKELRAYSWKTDRRGHIIDEPVDFLNHACDSFRYPIYSQFRGEGMYKLRWIK